MLLGIEFLAQWQRLSKCCSLESCDILAVEEILLILELCDEGSLSDFLVKHLKAAIERATVSHVNLISITNIPRYPSFLLPVRQIPKPFIFPGIFVETSNGSKPNTAAQFCENVSYPTWGSKHQDLSIGEGRRLGDEECAVLMQ